MEDLIEALSAIDVAKLDHNDWIAVGMALKAEGQSCSVWDDWSRNDVRYHPGECEKRWSSFQSSGVTGKTIFKMAHDNGWQKYKSLDWDSVINDGYTRHLEEKNIPEDSDQPGEQLIKYLNALFQPDEIIAFTTESFETDDGKMRPVNGSCTHTAQEIIHSIEHYGKSHEQLGFTIGDWDEKAGAWIAINPMDGSGRHNENVTAYRHVLVESDTIPVEQQEATWRNLGLPIAAIVESGGKSVHAIVKIEAANLAEYRDRVDQLYKWLAEKGIDIDKQNKNPARLSRMPGVTRNKKIQRLLGTNIGPAHWSDWNAGRNNNLPRIELLASSIDSLPPLAPEMIYGILRKGHKMLMSGDSKAGKSVLLMELAIALSHGWKWLDFQCARTKILYINMEIDSISCKHRFHEIYDALNANAEHRQNPNLYVWGLRGKAMPLEKLADILIEQEKISPQHWGVIIIDPLYKVMMGDENNASDMGMFCNHFDRIADSIGCSVVYCHHHSKGNQLQKRVIDRASGSGVFARDPDAQLDVTEIPLSSDEQAMYADKNANGVYQRAFVLEGNLREFAPFKPVNFWFKYPLHEVDHSKILEQIKKDTMNGQNLSNQIKRASANENFKNAWDRLELGQGFVTVNDMAAALNLSQRTIREKTTQMANEFKLSNGKIYRV